MMNPEEREIKIIDLVEYKSDSFDYSDITEFSGKYLYHKYRKQIDVEFPNYKTGYKWKLKAKGWVGYIPLNSEIALRIQPKVSIKNLWGMLEYAYELKTFHFIPGIMNCESLEAFYNRLANILAKRILERNRQGLYRTYLPKFEYLKHIRGRLDIKKATLKPWDVKLKCSYEEYTADIPENQILLWTLFIIGRSNLCSKSVSEIVRKAYHALQSSVKLKPYIPEDCIARKYNRLNKDYQLLHNLCRFFLEHTAPNYEKGNYTTLPFLVDMALLYETFVAQWLKLHLPSNLKLKSQEKIKIDKNLRFKTDLILYDSSNLTPSYILDTKYKNPISPSADDVAQVLAYAVAKNCKEVILVYPTSLTHPLDKVVGNIRVRSLTFSLNGDLDKSGQIFLKNIKKSYLKNLIY